MKQAENLAKHPVVFDHVALIPDAHQGYGMPIGGVIACDNAVIPAAVGVDIGCGMIATETDIPALRYAKENRRRMMEAMKETVAEFVPEGNFLGTIDIHHNYAACEEHFGKKVFVHRKGATSAKLDEIGIIPGSMGTASYIVRGLGNPDSFMSCSHGAGRRMSRIAATSSCVFSGSWVVSGGVSVPETKATARRRRHLVGPSFRERQDGLIFDIIQAKGRKGSLRGFELGRTKRWNWAR